MTEQRVSELREKTAELLETMGLRVEDAELRKLAREAGAKTDEALEVVYFPREVQEELLAKIPSGYSVRNVLGQEWVLGGDEQYIASIVMDPWMLEYPAGARRPRMRDLKTNLALIEGMPEVAQVSLMDFPVTDYPDEKSNLRALECFMTSHTKHYAAYVTSMESFRRWMELGEILNEGKPLRDSGLFTVAVASLSPMVINQLNCDLLREACAYHFPVVPTVCAMAGSTAPYSLVGIVLQSLAECLGIAMLSQVLNPGNPFLFALGPSVTNLATGHDMYYTMDKNLWRLAAGQLARSYHLPFIVECGGTMPARFDMQAGAESMLSMLFAVASGAHLLAGMGSCYNANGLAPEMIVIQNAWRRAALHNLRGIRFDHLDDAIESIRTQGHGGQFLTDDLTLELMRSNEFFSDPLFDYMGEFREDPSLYKRARATAARAEQEFHSAVPEKIQTEIHRYFQKLY